MLGEFAGRYWLLVNDVGQFSTVACRVESCLFVAHDAEMNRLTNNDDDGAGGGVDGDGDPSSKRPRLLFGSVAFSGNERERIQKSLNMKLGADFISYRPGAGGSEVCSTLTKKAALAVACW